MKLGAWTQPAHFRQVVPVRPETRSRADAGGGSHCVQGRAVLWSFAKIVDGRGLPEKHRVQGEERPALLAVAHGDAHVVDPHDVGEGTATVPGGHRCAEIGGVDRGQGKRLLPGVIEATVDRVIFGSDPRAWERTVGDPERVGAVA
jgi:hypothetical protein